MYTPEALLDIHSCTHSRFALLLQHCAQFSAEQLRQEHPGFGYSTLQQQLIHMVEAEKYWVDVLEGRFVEPDDPGDDGAAYEAGLQEKYHDIAVTEAWRQECVAATETYLARADAAELNTPREMRHWGGQTVLLPARVILRVVTHIFQHQGQVLAICRLFGQPSPGRLDFPIRPEYS